MGRALAEAEEKAYNLFLSLLTNEERDGFLSTGYVSLRGGSTGRKYYIHPGWSQNIRGEVIKPPSICSCPDCKKAGNLKLRSMCYHMRLNTPEYDHMIAQLLYIKFAEQIFLEEAYIG